MRGRENARWNDEYAVHFTKLVCERFDACWPEVPWIRDGAALRKRGFYRVLMSRKESVPERSVARNQIAVAGQDFVSVFERDRRKELTRRGRAHRKVVLGGLNLRQ